MSTPARLEARPALSFPPAVALIGHIIAKDMRRLWPLVLLWLVMLLDVGLARSSSAASFLAILPMQIVGICFLPALVILQDPLAGPDPFWRTRPIPLGLMLTGKAFFILFLVVLPILALESIQVAASGVAQAWKPALPWLSALWLIVSLMVVAATAAAVGSLARFTAFLLGTWVAMIFVSLAIYALLFQQHLADPGALPENWPGPVLVMLVLGLASGMLSLALLLRGRSPWLARALVAPPLLMLVMITPGENLLLSEVAALSWARPAPRIDVSIDSIRPAPDRGWNACDMAFLVKPDAPRLVVGSLRVIRRTDGRPTRPDTGWRRPVFGTGLTPQLMAPSLESAEWAFPASKVFWNLEPTSPATAAAGAPIDFDVEFGLQEVTLVTIPLAEAARVDHNDTSYRIRSLTVDTGRIGLTLEVTSLRTGFGDRTNDLFLIHRGRREVVTFSESSIGSPGDPGLPIPWPVVHRREATVRTERQLPGWDDTDSASATGPFRWKRGPLDDEWLRGAELVVVERVHRGVVTRSFRGVAIDSTEGGGG